MSNLYMSGSKTRYATKKSKVYAEGRVCIEEGCEVTLSKYNDRKQCYVHHKFKQPRVRGHLDARDKK